MSCVPGVKLLVNEYEHLNPLEEIEASGMPLGVNCQYLSTVSGQYHLAKYFLGTHHYENLSIANCLAVFGLRDFLEEGGLSNIAVYAADDPDFTVNLQFQVFTVTISDLVGFESRDWFGNLTNFTVGKPYWSVLFYSSYPTNRPIRKLILGEAVRFSRNPSYPAQFILVEDSIEATRLKFRVRLNFQGLSMDDKILAIDRILENQDFIHGALIDENDDLLLGNKIMMTRIDSADILLRAAATGIDLNLELLETL